MSDKKKTSRKNAAKTDKKIKVVDSLVQGARDGLTGEALYAHLQAARPDLSDKAVVKAGFQALQLAALTDKPVLDAIYELTIAKRLKAVPAVEIAAAEAIEGGAVVEPVAEPDTGGTVEKKRRKKAA